MSSTSEIFTDADWPRIARYLTGDMQPGERTEFDAWLAANPQAAATFQHLRAEWEDVPHRVSGDWDAEKALATITRSSHGRAAYLQSVQSSFRYLGIAAALVIGFFAIKYIPNLTTTTTSAPTTKIYATTPGQRANIQLANGSRVTLAPATTLTITGNIATLTGHAIFTVIQTPSNPFTVTANGAVTKVLGTTFAVRAYPGEGRTRVVVRDGRVSVQPPTVTPNATVVLSANQGVYVEPDGRTRMLAVGAVDDFAIAKGQLVLREAPVGEALLEMSRWFALDFRTTDSSLLTRQITTTLPEQLTQGALRDLADALGARVTRAGNTVTFEPR